MTKKKRKPKEPEPLTYYLRIEEFEVGYTYSIRQPEMLSKLELNMDYGGQRPSEP